jgi:hypothetical protein
VTQPDDVMTAVGRGIGLGQSGQRAEARELFAQLWQQVTDTGDPFHRCAIAHSMADVQDDPHAELTWDLRALDAADAMTDERVLAAGGAAPVSSFYPSLHLNLGEVYRKLGDLDEARTHLRLGQEAAKAFGTDGYATMVIDGLTALAKRIDADAERGVS